MRLAYIAARLLVADPSGCLERLVDADADSCLGSHGAIVQTQAQSSQF